MHEYIKRLIILFKDPSNFARNVARETGYWNVLKVFVIFYMSILIIRLLLSIGVTLRGGGILSAELILSSLIAGLIAAFIVPFFWSGVTHLGVLIFGGRQGFFNTFKVATYSWILILIYGLVIPLIASVLLLIKPLGTIEVITQLYTSVFGVAMLVVSLAGFVHVIIAETIGLSLLHKISRIRAFLSAILIPLILMVVFYGVVVWLLSITMGSL
jgi:hypothetical protein